MKLTISIVNWNVCAYLQKCLESVYKYSQGIELEVIVIDNASSDASVAMLKEKFPQVKVIENKENVGYGSAHNQAVEEAFGEYILFLNPDTEMLPQTLPRAVAFMDEYPRAAALLCREIGDERSAGETVLFMTRFRKFLWFSCLRIQRAWPNRWTRDFFVNRIAQAYQDALSLYIYAKKKVISENGYIFSRQEYLEGAFLLVRRCVLAQTGGFDPKFFLGDEGFELTHRFRKIGWELYYLFDVHVIHYGEKSCEGLSNEDFDRMREEWRRKTEALEKFS
jgi:GT2 family glycosyltransferase